MADRLENNESTQRFGIGAILQSNTAVMIGVMIVVILIFTVIDHNFFSFNNAMNILQAATIVGLLAIGQTFLIIAGHIDLSCASVAALSGVVFAVLMRDAGVALPFALIIAFVVAIVVGLINAALVNVFELQPFIATLAMGSVAHGVAYLLSNGKAVAIASKGFNSISTTFIAGVPLPALIMIILFIIFGFILARTVFGRTVYMIGGNAAAARLAGIKPKQVATQLYILSAAVAAVAGTLYCARMFSALPGAATGSEFDAITAVVLGGVAFTGGKGNMAGCFVGLIIIQCFSNGLTVIGVAAFWQVVAKGLLLVAALIFDYVRRKKLAVN